MTSMQIGLIVVIVVIGVIAAGAWLWWHRRQSLRKRIGPEYDRAVAAQASRSAAERELRERERRHAELALEPLAPQSRDRYTQEWEQVQAQFLDDPAAAVVAGDKLVTRLVAETGLPH